jgi:P-type E1-E2 ATPase
MYLQLMYIVLTNLGANDVSMIQEASIGVGLFGKEGTQAARSADYAIRRFKHIKRLLFVHGRYSLLRNSSLIHYSIYKNACFALGQYWFAIFCGFSGQVRILL